MWTTTCIMRVGLVGIVALALSRPALAAEPELRALFDQAQVEFDEAQGLRGDQPARARQLFRSAARRFGTIVAAGVTNGRLEYNLANSHLQAGDVGRAILHYRRAERLIPRDPMLADNLGVARSRCLTSIESTRGGALLRSIFFWHYQTSVAGRTTAALCLYLMFWFLLIARCAAPVRAVTVSAVVCGLLAASLAGSVAMSRWSDRTSPPGVVTEMDVTVFKGPGSGYQRQFEQPLQPGVEFSRREKTSGGWWKIELADGKTGWIEASHADLIPFDAAQTYATH